MKTSEVSEDCVLEVQGGQEVGKRKVMEPPADNARVDEGGGVST